MTGDCLHLCSCAVLRRSAARPTFGGLPTSHPISKAKLLPGGAGETRQLASMYVPNALPGNRTSPRAHTAHSVPVMHSTCRDELELTMLVFIMLAPLGYWMMWTAITVAAG